MVELVLISGRGGAGKTSLAGSFAAMSGDMILCDADVESSKLQILLSSMPVEQHDVFEGQKAMIDPDLCTRCGECFDRCRFGAMSTSQEVDASICEGCGTCWNFCPMEAISPVPDLCGTWYRSVSRVGPLFHARLAPGGQNPERLVREVRKQARALARAGSTILTVGAPGTGRPATESISGADGALIVLEPAVDWRDNLMQLGQLAEFQHIPVIVCTNKWDINPGAAQEIESICRERGYVFAGRLAYNPVFTLAQIERKTVPEFSRGSSGECLTVIWNNVRRFCLEFDQDHLATPLIQNCRM